MVYIDVYAAAIVLARSLLVIMFINTATRQPARSLFRFFTLEFPTLGLMRIAALTQSFHSRQRTRMQHSFSALSTGTRTVDAIDVFGREGYYDF